ncbi:MAG: hypothetical protein JWM36_2726 [Hyphomicrobiales bacterium]|nr:hypothetical protein [Hyphomicrobiales bacterium]
MSYGRSFSMQPLPPLTGLATIARMAFEGKDFAPLVFGLQARLAADANDAAALLDLSTIEQIRGNRENGIALQAAALSRQQHYTHYPATPARDRIRLLAVMAPGDFMANTPLQFLLEESSTVLDVLYICPDVEFPASLPDCDLVFVAVAESDDNRDLLRRVGEVALSPPRPMVNAPHNIARLTRDGAWQILHEAPGISYPVNLRCDRSTLVSDLPRAFTQETPLGTITYPLIVRPLDSHAGAGLAKIEDKFDLADYLSTQSAEQFYVAPFIDYRSVDGHYRKFRVVLIAGVPWPVHMAISDHWMIHYLNADMINNPSNRLEEELFMSRFKVDFARRHAGAFHEIHQRTQLDYVLLDCAEIGGELLIFEIGTAMIVHSLDPVEVFPYKKQHMLQIFAAFGQMLDRRRLEAERGPLPGTTR